MIFKNTKEKNLNINLGKSQRYKGFTLAEVLMTLGIVGIVAALTIPSFVGSYRDKQAVSQVKKNYSVFSQAFTNAIRENGTIDNWDLSGYISVKILDYIAPYLQITKNCKQNAGCYPDKFYTLNGSGPTNYDTNVGSAKAQMSDGSIIKIAAYNNNCSYKSGSSIYLENICGELLVDINGLKLPNQAGKDSFYFWITKHGIIPVGTIADTAYSFDEHCNKNTGSGLGCTAWVLYKENLEYLKCTGLSWTAKQTCN